MEHGLSTDGTSEVLEVSSTAMVPGAEQLQRRLKLPGRRSWGSQSCALHADVFQGSGPGVVDPLAMSVTAQLTPQRGHW